MSESNNGNEHLLSHLDEEKLVALIYLNHQDISDKSPEELWTLYKESCDKIRRKASSGKKQRIDM